jgi:hypothetical protein
MNNFCPLCTEVALFSFGLCKYVVIYASCYFRTFS